VRDGVGLCFRYTIVQPAEADVTRGCVSYLAPVGAALLGRRAGETVAVRVPNGERALTLVSVE
jgi:transcription elongation GreA/GreB family factor